MDPNDNPIASKPVGFFTRLLLWIAGADGETLKKCPAADWENVKAVAVIMICVWVYQTALFSLIGQELFAAPGTFRPDILVASGFLGAFILAFDSYAVIRSGWYAQGIELLKRGGLDVSGGAWARIKAGLFLTVRVLLSVALAQLTAIFLSLLIFSADITAQLHDVSLSTNGALIADATAQADRDLQRAAEIARAEEDRYGAVTAEVAAARQSQLDPAAADVEVRQAQKELDDSQSDKAKADAAVTAAETFETDELGGIKGAPGNSGQPGPGYRHKAALERLVDARKRAQDAAKRVEAARNRLDAIRKQRGAAGLVSSQQAKEQLPQLEGTLKDEEARLSSARDALESLTRNRDEAIRRSVEQAPGYVPTDDGLLSELTALERVAGDDPKIKAVIILIDLTSFGFELAAVLAKVTAFVPTTYAALLVADNYAAVVRIVDRLAQQIEQGPKGDDTEILTPEPEGGTGDGPEPELDQQSSFPAFAPDPFGRAAEEPPKRPRGRPRKTSLN